MKKINNFIEIIKNMNYNYIGWKYMKKNVFFIIVFIFILLFLLNKTYAASISSKEQFLNNIKLNSSIVSLSGVKYYIILLEIQMKEFIL